MDVLGEILPLALGISLSPFPAIGAVLALRTSDGRRSGVTFLAGFLAGLVVLVLGAELIGGALPVPSEGEGSGVVAAAISIVLGGLLVVVAGRKLVGRPGEDEVIEAPRWMSSVATMSSAKVFGLGLALAAANPKNLLLTIAAGVVVGAADLPGRAAVLTTIAFVGIGASAVLVPVVAALVAYERILEPLDRAHDWLLRNNTTVLAVVLLVLGGKLVGDGLTKL